MVFESPIWLLGLLPWAAVVLFLLPGKGRPQGVSYLEFWRGPAMARSRTVRRLPPLSVGLILLALLLTVLAAGQPAISRNSKISGDVTIILDRGVSMALPSVSGRPFRNVIRKCAASLGSLGSANRVTLIAIPGTTIETTGDAWIATAQAMTATIVPVSLDAIVTDRLRNSRGLVVILTDQTIDIADPRIVQIWPDAAEPCVAITAMAARSSPSSQVMIRLENHSNRSSVQMKISSAGSVVERTISLPPSGQSVNQFVDVNNSGDVLTAEIDSDPEGNPWARPSLIKQPSGSRIIAERALPNSIQRIAAIYSKDRAGDVNFKSIFVSTQQVDEQQPGIWLRVSSSALPTNSTWSVTPHPLTQNVTTLPMPGEAISPPAGFTPVASFGHSTVIAVREDAVRQIWINADFREWEKTTDFVIFFANAFDWLGGASWRYMSTNHLPPDVNWPGIYRDDSGKQIAINAGLFPIDRLSHHFISADLPHLASQRTSIKSWVTIASLICLVLAASRLP